MMEGKGWRGENEILKITEISYGEKNSRHTKSGIKGERCVGEKKTKQMIARVDVCAVTVVWVPSRVLVRRELSTGNFLRTSIVHGVISRLLTIKESTRLRGPAPFMKFALEVKLAQESLPSLPVGAREEGKHRTLFVMIFGERENVLRFSRDYFMLPACTELSESRACVIFPE